MEIEIVEFYPDLDKKPLFKNLIGSMHVYIIEDKIDLRGVRVFLNRNGLYFKMPCLVGLDEETKKKVLYPLFSYQDREKDKKLREQIKIKGTKYIQEKSNEKNKSENKKS